MADRQRVYEGRPGLAEWGEDLGEFDPRVLRAVRAGFKANVMPSPSGVPFAGLVESTKSLPALPMFLGDLFTGGKYGLSESAPEFALEASEKYDELIQRYLAEEGLREAERLGVPEKFGLAAGEMLGQLPVPGKLLERVTEKLPKAFKPAGWLAEYFGPTVDPKAINYAIGTGVGGTLRTATGEEEPEKFAKGGLGKRPELKYQGQHGPASRNYGAPAHDLTAIYPDDVYGPKAAHYYGSGGDPEWRAVDRQTITMLQGLKGKPDAEITIYRAVPNDPSITDINIGDWVTINPKYAKIHGESNLGGEYKIISKKVPAKDIVTSGDSFHEWGYNPEAQGFARGGLGRKSIVRKTEEGVTEAAPPKLEGTTIVKEPGGNWIPGSVENFINIIRDQYVRARERPAERLARLEKQIAEGSYPHTEQALAMDKATLEAQTSVDRWLEKKLANYIRNDMATERDPVRLGVEQRVAKAEADKAKADQRVAKQQAKIAEARAAGRDTTAAEQRLEIEMADLAQKYELDRMAAVSATEVDPIIANAAERSRQGGGIAVSPEATIWEDMTDYLVDTRTAGGLRGDTPYDTSLAGIANQAPWLNDVPYDTPVYSVAGSTELFDHIRDELYNAVWRDSDLPPNLRLEPKDLEKMNVDAVVAHVGKINAYREQNRIAEKLSQAESPAVFSVKQYPGTGLEWKQIKMPEIKELPEIETRQRSATQGEFRVPGDPNWYAADDIGSSYLDFEGKARDLLGTRALREALEYEGGVMGHCVGGYCDRVKAGGTQIFSLRDARGEPHVTIEVKPKDVARAVGDLRDAERIALAQEVKDKYFGGIMPGRSDEDKYHQLIDQTYVEKYGEPPPDIIQIKGKGNRKPAAKYIPYVQDFVKSGNFGNIRDLQNAELIKLGNRQYITEQEFGPMRENALRFLSEHPLFESARRAEAEYSEFKGDIPSPEYSAVDRARGAPVAPDIPYTWRELEAILTDPRAWSSDDVSTALKHTLEIARRAGIEKFADGGRVDGEDYDEDRIEAIVAPLREKLESFLGEAQKVPRKAKQAVADITEIGDIIKRSTKIPLDYYDPKSEVAGEADAMRHLLFQAQLARKYGETPAKIVSYLNEYTSLGQPAAEREMDFYNDALGRELGLSATSDDEIIELARKYVDTGRVRVLPEEQRGGY